MPTSLLPRHGAAAAFRGSSHPAINPDRIVALITLRGRQYRFAATHIERRTDAHGVERYWMRGAFHTPNGPLGSGRFRYFGSRSGSVPVREARVQYVSRDREAAAHV
jgi:hypothetical protein